MSVTIRAKLPKGDEDGLGPLETRLADDPNATIVAVVILQTDTIEARPHDAENPRVVKCVALHVEPLLDNGDRIAADKLLRMAYEQRTGKAELPLYADADGDAD